MSPIRSRYSDSLRFFGGTSPARLVAEHGSPLYVYNEDILRARCREMKNLVARPEVAADARARLSAAVEVWELDHDDSWVRDSGPTFLLDDAGNTLRVVESGGKYDAERVAAFHEHCAENRLTYELW